MSKTAIVTGGGGEIGSAISSILSKYGYDMIVTYNSKKEKAEKTLKSLSMGNNAIFHAPNTSQDKIAELIQFVESEFGSLELLVNKAGTTTSIKYENLQTLSDKWIDKIMQTNFRGLFAKIRAFEPLLRKSINETTHFLNIPSTAGIYGIGSNAAYCASKAAMDSMTRSLARALAPKICVKSMPQGFVDGDYAKSFDHSFLKDQFVKKPLKRFALGIDVSNAELSAAEHLTFSTGNTIALMVVGYSYKSLI